ncbi:hypothetical protein B0O80DRAFT_39890 [Mortierella sp. GBAus27b]|nr:hypothetical protein B0O80DRAFT_39890 [Mortierella sp. GBAus27b]
MTQTSSKPHIFFLHCFYSIPPLPSLPLPSLHAYRLFFYSLSRRQYPWNVLAYVLAAILPSTSYIYRTSLMSYVLSLEFYSLGLVTCHGLAQASFQILHPHQALHPLLTTALATPQLVINSQEVIECYYLYTDSTARKSFPTLTSNSPSQHSSGLNNLAC